MSVRGALSAPLVLVGAMGALDSQIPAGARRVVDLLVPLGWRVRVTYALAVTLPEAGRDAERRESIAVRFTQGPRDAVTAHGYAIWINGRFSSALVIDDRGFRPVNVTALVVYLTGGKAAGAKAASS